MYQQRSRRAPRPIRGGRLREVSPARRDTEGGGAQVPGSAAVATGAAGAVPGGPPRPTHRGRPTAAGAGHRAVLEDAGRRSPLTWRWLFAVNPVRPVSRFDQFDPPRVRLSWWWAIVTWHRQARLRASRFCPERRTPLTMPTNRDRRCTLIRAVPTARGVPGSPSRRMCPMGGNRRLGRGRQVESVLELGQDRRQPVDDEGVNPYRGPTRRPDDGTATRRARR